MLHYTLKHRADGLEVRFHQLRGRLWAILFATLPLVIGGLMVWYFAQRMGHKTTWGVFIDLGIEGILIIAAAFILLGLRFLADALTTSQFVFQNDGIKVKRGILGFPRESLWYSKAGVYAFGPAVRGHSREPVLKFAYPGEGDWIVLAHDVDESDANNFVEFLCKEGYEFNNSWDEPPRPSKVFNLVTDL